MQIFFVRYRIEPCSAVKKENRDLSAPPPRGR